MRRRHGDATRLRVATAARRQTRQDKAGCRRASAAGEQPKQWELRAAMLVADTDYVGEIGLDGSRGGRPSLPQQRRVFAHVLGAPGVRNCVLSVHSRGAEAETIERPAETLDSPRSARYSGALKHAEQAVDAGLYFSINAAMLRSQKGARLVRSLPRDRVLTETDGPYVIGGRAAEPHLVPLLVNDLAGAWSCDPEVGTPPGLDQHGASYAGRNDATRGGPSHHLATRRPTSEAISMH